MSKRKEDTTDFLKGLLALETLGLVSLGSIYLAKKAAARGPLNRDRPSPLVQLYNEIHKLSIAANPEHNNILYGYCKRYLGIISYAQQPVDAAHINEVKAIFDSLFGRMPFESYVTTIEITDPQLLNASFTANSVGLTMAPQGLPMITGIPTKISMDSTGSFLTFPYHTLGSERIVPPAMGPFSLDLEIFFNAQLLVTSHVEVPAGNPQDRIHPIFHSGYGVDAPGYDVGPFKIYMQSYDYEIYMS